MSLPAVRPSLDLLLAHAHDYRPVLDRSIAIESAGAEPLPEQRPKPPFQRRHGKPPNDLFEQGWGIIAPLGDQGDRLLDLVRPLIERRRAQLGGREPNIYRVPSDIRELSEAARWKKRIFKHGRDLDNTLPWYQLILGDLPQVSLAIQQVQSTDGLVGRIAFDRDDDYRAYVTKVLRWEDHPTRRQFGDAILHSIRDRTQATDSAYQWLMKPGFAILQRQWERGHVQAETIRESGTMPPSPDELVRVASSAPASVLFSVSHGVGAPRTGWRTVDDQRALQGAMSFGPDASPITGADMMTGPFLPGGVWFMLACFSAGTTDTSPYRHWLEQLRQAGHVGERDVAHISSSLALPGSPPFIGSLAKAALSNPDGPQAFIGHVDLSWSFGFRDFDQRPMNRPGRFMNVIQELLGYSRVGVGFQAINRSLDEVNTELTALYNERAEGHATETREPARLPSLWMLRQDLAGYILLGDPAIRLPLNKMADRVTPTTRPAELISKPSAATEGLEVAIGKVLASTYSLEQGAIACGRTLDEFRLDFERYRRAGRHALGMDV